MKIGIDIEQVSRFKEAPSAFLETIFTPEELAFAHSHSQPEIHLCGLFCAKEAVKKALSEPLSFKEIEIRHGENGKPFVLLPQKRRSVQVSIAHTIDCAVAVVVCDD